MDIELLKKQILNSFNEGLDKVDNKHSLYDLKSKFLGKKSVINQELKKLSDYSPEEKKEYGGSLNSIRQEILSIIKHTEDKLDEEELQKKLNYESIDITLPGRKYSKGRIHPLSQVIREVKQIFSYLGFTHVSGPEIEEDWYNFTALNVPEDHPAREMHDTFYCLNHSKLLRTHTSAVEIRHLLKNEPPVKVISVGRVYRSDYDATHTPMFHQLEGIHIGDNINVTHLKNCIEVFLRLFFNVKKLPIRFRVSYFPFTEPSFEVDVLCDRSKKGDIKIGEGNDWLEIMGCGILHQKVLKSTNVSSDKYQGFAFGMGLERLAMVKYGISDLRSFFENDIRWLNHFGF